MATALTQMCLSVMLYVHYLPCLSLLLFSVHYPWFSSSYFSVHTFQMIFVYIILQKRI